MLQVADGSQGSISTETQAPRYHLANWDQILMRFYPGKFSLKYWVFKYQGSICVLNKPLDAPGKNSHIVFSRIDIDEYHKQLPHYVAKY